jgi:predicted aspartyl protease
MAPLRHLFGLLLLLVLAGCDPPSEIDCNLTMIAQMPLRVEDHLLVVPAGINGKWVHLIVDSGAERTTISDATAERLGLPHDPRYKVRSTGIGGTTVSTDVTVDRLVLGGVHFPLERIAVGSFKLQNGRGLNADGLLGADILLAFDLDIDVPGGQLTLYRARRCPAARLPWQEPGAEITGVKARKDRLLIPFELDGATGLAILDTGAQREVVGVAMARRLDLNGQAMDGDPMVRQHGVGPMAVMTHLHKFKLLRIGPVVQHSPRLAVMETDAGMGDALIGEEFLRGRRVWLSFSNRQVYVSLTPPTPP